MHCPGGWAGESWNRSRMAAQPVDPARTEGEQQTGRQRQPGEWPAAQPEATDTSRRRVVSRERRRRRGGFLGRWRVGQLPGRGEVGAAYAPRSGSLGGSAGFEPVTRSADARSLLARSPRQANPPPGQGRSLVDCWPISSLSVRARLVRLGLRRRRAPGTVTPRKRSRAHPGWGRSAPRRCARGAASAPRHCRARW